MPVWTDLVLTLTKAPYITVALIRGRTRGVAGIPARSDQSGLRILTAASR